MNLFGLDNVKLAQVIVDDAKERNVEVFRLEPIVAEVVTALVADKPLWTFECREWSHTYEIGDSKGMNITGLSIIQDGVNLGRVCRARARGGEMGVYVHNERISNLRNRGGGLITKDAKKAIATIKKTFFPVTLAERVQKATEHTENRLAVNTRHKSREVAGAESKVREELLFFAHSKEGKAIIMDYWNKTDVVKANKVREDTRRVNALTDEHRAMLDLERKFADGETLLVVRTDNGYITRLKGEVKEETDSTLPEHVRAKLGMLKLVQNEEAVTTVGFRVDENTFVIDLGEEDA